MKKFYIIGFLVLMACDTLAQTGIKLATLHAGEMSLHWSWAREMLCQPWLYIALASFLGAFVTWMTLLEHAPVGPAFAASHLELVTVLMVSVTCLGEALTRSQVAGCVLIVAGIAVLGMQDAEAAGEKPQRQPAA